MADESAGPGDKNAFVVSHDNVLLWIVETWECLPMPDWISELKEPAC